MLSPCPQEGSCSGPVANTAQGPAERPVPAGPLARHSGKRFMVLRVCLMSQQRTHAHAENVDRSEKPRVNVDRSEKPIARLATLWAHDPKRAWSLVPKRTRSWKLADRSRMTKERAELSSDATWDSGDSLREHAWVTVPPPAPARTSCDIFPGERGPRKLPLKAVDVSNQPTFLPTAVTVFHSVKRLVRRHS